MWPFTRPAVSRLSFRSVDPRFAVAGQVHPEQLNEVAAAGFELIVCARPDHEEPGQPTFAEVARAAEAAGLRAVHIPVSGMLGEGALIRMQEALASCAGPVLGYCRSGGRAGSLYAAVRSAAG
jgi:uncharacterized protein (TIGR01244 family)